MNRPSHLSSIRSLVASASLLALALACRQEQVQHYRVPKEAATAAPMGDMGGMAPGQPDMPEVPKPQAGGLHWSLPKGWSETPGDGMRFATLKTPISGRVEATVVVLPGPAGGELANVNRWRSQIALPPMDEAALAKARTQVKSKAGAINVYDFTSDGQAKSRVVAGLIATPDGNTWFLKLTGDATLVAKARPDFMQILGSLHLD
jgi:hypothetical protein